MLEKLNAVRTIPQEKEKTSKVILYSVTAFILGLILALLRQNTTQVFYLIFHNATLNMVLSSLDYCNFYPLLELMILFFIAFKSTKPSYSAIFSLSFLVPDYLYGYIFILNFTKPDPSINKICETMTMISAIVLKTLIGYILWYAKGKGTFADIIIILSVSAPFSLIGMPLFSIYSAVFHMTAYENAPLYLVYSSTQIITAAVLILIFITFGIMLMFYLRKCAKERLKLLGIAIIIGVLMAAAVFSKTLSSAPISTHAVLMHEMLLG